MSNVVEVNAVLEDSKFQGVQHVSIDKTVEEIKKGLQTADQVVFTARQSEISRAGVIMKRVQEETKAKITKMRTENRVQKRPIRSGDKQAKEGEAKEEAEYKVIYFRATFTK